VLVPAGITKDNAVKVFRDHEFLAAADPDLVEYKPDTAPWPQADAMPASKTSKYSMTANAQILPKAISSGSAVGYRTFWSELDNGVTWGVTSSFGMDQLSTWTVEAATVQDMKEAGESGSADGRLVTVQDVNITAGRLVMPSVKGKVTNEWKETHARFHERMRAIQEGKFKF
jgi:hypothetical protein